MVVIFIASFDQLVNSFYMQLLIVAIAIMLQFYRSDKYNYDHHHDDH